jgi:DNA invertase Pin-like site-specific DNA recombinase
MRAVGYVRVSTEVQGADGNGAEWQRDRLTAAAAERGWELELVTEVASAGSMRKRTELAGLLERLDAGEAEALVVTKVDRLARNVLDVAKLAQRAEAKGWALVVLELGLDTSTPAGRFVLQTMANVAELERELIRQRTRESMAVVRKRGKRLGRPVELPAAVRERIVAERAGGATLQAIADRLTADGVPTARGGKWHPVTVRNVVLSVAEDAEARARAELYRLEQQAKAAQVVAA